ncbi:MAG: hypothetical protein IKP68_03740 [Clostridia bacterium]|nr:hypothetical protein [Clostridia bacterium]
MEELNLSELVENFTPSEMSAFGLGVQTAFGFVSVFIFFWAVVLFVGALVRRIESKCYPAEERHLNFLDERRKRKKLEKMAEKNISLKNDNGGDK